jgi:hypothetical protein
MVSATPNTPSSSSVSNLLPKNPTKTAPIDTVLFDDNSMSIEIMTDLIFEDIGGQELATISRHDLVNGQKVVYNPIKNLTDLYLQYNPNNILRLQSSDSYFKSLPISILDRLPVCGNAMTLLKKRGSQTRLSGQKCQTASQSILIQLVET